jgi:phospholipid transport system substrate-binding protein
MKKYASSVISALVLMFSLAWVTVLFAADGSSPVALLQSIADNMISGLKAHQATLKSNPGVVYSLANRYVVPHADLDEMSRRVLPARTWQAATPAQKAQFKKQFTKTLIRTYASAIAEYRDETIKFFPVRGGAGGGSVRVDSQIIRTDGPTISVSYTLVNKGGWKLVDMTVEGISMLQSFRSQFSDKLGSEDIEGLIHDLSSHNTSHGG